MTDTILQILQDWGYHIFAIAMFLKMLFGTVRRFKKLF